MNIMVNKLKYQLSQEENDKIDDYWKFIKVFNVNNNNFLYSPREYRSNLIKKIKKKYTIDEFYFYEKILNKMLWNLLVIYKIFLNKIDFTTKLAFRIRDGSCINKQIMFIEENNIIFPEYRNLKSNNKVPQDLFKILTILRSRDMYEKVIKDKDYINNIKKIDDFYYPSDYPFPNVNLIEYNNNNKDIWIKRIKAYYFMKDDENWYKLII
jgi:hypothetical protein